MNSKITVKITSLQWRRVASVSHMKVSLDGVLVGGNNCRRQQGCEFWMTPGDDIVSADKATLHVPIRIDRGMDLRGRHTAQGTSNGRSNETGEAFYRENTNHLFQE